MTTCAHTRISTRLAGVLGIVLFGASCSDSPLGYEQEDWSASAVSATLVVGAPTTGARLEGVTQFRAAVDGQAVSTYDMSWDVDDGQPNAMHDDGAAKAATVDVSGWTWRGEGPYTVTFVARRKRGNKVLGRHSVQVYVVQPSPPAGEEPAGSLFGALMWVNPSSNAKKQADEWRTSRPEDAAHMDRIAGQPDAQWFGDWNADIQADVARMTGTITAAGRLPVYVAYNIPVRDCNSYSGGGATSGSAYRSWIRSFAAGLGSTGAVVILEPDALAGLSCLSAAQQDERFALIADAVSVLKAQGSEVYIDAGHPAWIGVSEMAGRLERANVVQADGFSINVSNFQTTARNLEYGVALSGALSAAGKRFVIDTSRNGLGPDANNEWCNPDGRALGNAPGVYTGHELAVAYLWIKKPGESDGPCNGGPSAGSWWGEYALGLAERAGVMVAYGG